MDNTKDNGLTALSIASYNQNFQILKCLVDAGSDVNATSSDGMGALNLAIQFENLPSIEYLI